MKPIGQVGHPGCDVGRLGLAFLHELKADIARTSSRSVVVFVHGYNYGFARHCEVAAELQRSLQAKARVLMLSWPPNGRPSDYIPDQADVEWSVPFLAETLEGRDDLLGARRRHVGSGFIELILNPVRSSVAHT